MTFRALPLEEWLSPEGRSPGATYEFGCEDGFSSSIPAATLFGEGRALLAIEDPHTPWPAIEGHPDRRPGPFYLVWENPETAGIVPEEWPYEVVRIALRVPPDQEFAGLHPKRGSLTESARNGMSVFIRHCMSCHRLNGAGRSTIGPDLNTPMSPTEYFREEALRKYIREPQSLRSWPDQKMPSFREAVLPDRDLADLIAYLELMARDREPGWRRRSE